LGISQIVDSKMEKQAKGACRHPSVNTNLIFNRLYMLQRPKKVGISKKFTDVIYNKAK
jgi:hypothetical protein